jgi:hypothetical protein
MLIKTIEELKQRIGKFIIISEYDEKCRDEHSSMKLLTKIEDSWVRHSAFTSGESSELLGWKIYGKYAATLDPFMPYMRGENGETYGNMIRYARDPTQEEIKEFKNCWRKLIYQKYYVKPFHPSVLIP